MHKLILTLLVINIGLTGWNLIKSEQLKEAIFSGVHFANTNFKQQNDTLSLIKMYTVPSDGPNHPGWEKTAN